MSMKYHEEQAAKEMELAQKQNPPTPGAGEQIEK